MRGQGHWCKFYPFLAWIRTAWRMDGQTDWLIESRVHVDKHLRIMHMRLTTTTTTRWRNDSPSGLTRNVRFAWNRWKWMKTLDLRPPIPGPTLSAAAPRELPPLCLPRELLPVCRPGLWQSASTPRRWRILPTTCLRDNLVTKPPTWLPRETSTSWRRRWRRDRASSSSETVFTVFTFIVSTNIIWSWRKRTPCCSNVPFVETLNSDSAVYFPGRFYCSFCVECRFCRLVKLIIYIYLYLLLLRFLTVFAALAVLPCRFIFDFWNFRWTFLGNVFLNGTEGQSFYLAFVPTSV